MTTEQALETIKKDIADNKVFLYMKGNPEAPQCGFSAHVVQILRKYDVNFGSRDVLADWDIREGVKEFTKWPTIPQLYVEGKFVGGCDIIADMDRKGTLAAVFSEEQA